MVTFTVITTGSPKPQPIPASLSDPTTMQTAAKSESTRPAEQRNRRIVVKFGGSSLSDRDRIAQAAQLISKESKKGTKLVVVVSAIGKMTDQLIGLVNHESGKAPNKTDLDDVLAMGERTSVRVFATALKAEGLEAKYFDPSEEQWPIITDDQFSNGSMGCTGQ